MKLIIVYILLNALVSIMLEKSRSKYRAATVVHAAAFTAVLLMLTASQPTGLLAGISTAIFGVQGREILQSMMFADELGAASPIVLLEILMPALVIAISAILTAKAVEYVYGKKVPLAFRREQIKKLFKRTKTSSPVINRIYLVNCVMRC